MEIIQGKTTRQISAVEFAQRVAGYNDVLLDLGTGDGRFVLQAARANPGLFAIGVDASRENLVEGSRKAPHNALFVIAGAEKLPADLRGVASRVTINFPWGSLLQGLLKGEPGLLEGLRLVTCQGALLEVRLNASALNEAGWPLEPGARCVVDTLQAAGFSSRKPVRLGAAELRGLPTTWAKRLAYGRDPRAFLLSLSAHPGSPRRQPGGDRYAAQD